MTDACLPGAIEWLEDMGKVFSRDAATVIFYRDHDDVWLDAEMDVN
jgi:hypothetical protein